MSDDFGAATVVHSGHKTRVGMSTESTGAVNPLDLFKVMKRRLGSTFEYYKKVDKIMLFDVVFFCVVEAYLIGYAHDELLTL